MALQRKTIWTIALAVAIVCAGTGTYLFLNIDHKPRAAAQTEQRTVKVQKGNIRVSISGTSQLQTQNIQNITAPADGTIKTMNLTRSQPVKQGDILLEISNSSLEADLKNAQASLEKMRKDLDDLIRQQQHLRIVAPASGKLTIAGNLDVGSGVNPTTKVGTISDNSTLTVKLPFPLQEAVQLKPGDEVDLSVSGYALTKTGTVMAVGKDVKPDASGNRLVDLEIAVQNDGTLDAGMEVTGSVILNGREVKAEGAAKLEYVKTVAFLAETSGTIADMKRKSGDFVQAGEVIAVVENDTLQDSILAKQADIERQEANVQNLQQRVDELTVRAPFDGVFSTDFANQKANVLAAYPVGASVKAGVQFGAVTSFDVMTLPIQVDELDLLNVKPGLKAEVRVDAVPGRVFEGEVTQVSTVGVTTNGVTYYDAIVAVPNKDQLLKYGMTATAEILIQDKRGVLTIPIEALQIQRGNMFVTVKNADGTLKENVPIKIGARSETQVEVVEGLQEGDEVVVPTRQRATNVSQQEIQRIRQQFQFGPGGGGGPGGGNFQFNQFPGGGSGANRGGR